MVWPALSSRTFPYITAPSNVSYRLWISLRHNCSLKIYRSPDKNEHEICAWLLLKSAPLPLLQIETCTMLEKYILMVHWVFSAQFNSILSINHRNFEDNRIVSSHGFSLRLTDSSDLVICDPFSTSTEEFMFFLFRLVHSICVFNFIFTAHKSFFFHRIYINCYYFFPVCVTFAT